VTSGDIAQRILGLEITGSAAGWEKLARDLAREVEIRDRKLDELRAALQGRQVRLKEELTKILEDHAC